MIRFLFQWIVLPKQTHRIVSVRIQLLIVLYIPMFQMNVLICVHSVLVSILLTYIKPERRATVRVMVFNATFNNILVIFWRSVLLVEETGVPGENHQPVTRHC
jgi:hypothetical protein